MKSYFIVVSAMFSCAVALDIHHAILDSKTMSYNRAVQYCDSKAMRLCSKEEICANKNPPIIGVLNQDRWVPISDGENDWVQVGEDRLCYRHNEHYSPPSWGISGGCLDQTDDCVVRKHVLCCAGVQLDGAYMTWQVGRSYCLERGQDLCKHRELCDGSKLTKMPVPSGDHWAPVLDRYNDWTEVGDDAGRTCFRHIAQYGMPTWGTKIGDCSPWNTNTHPCPHKGYVLCCPSNDPASKPSPYPYNIFHFILDPNHLTWQIANSFCHAQKRSLCLAKEICPLVEPLLTGVLLGDNWTPIGDVNSQEINDWMEIGDDINRQGKRVCWKHVEHYGATSWGAGTAGSCSTWEDSDGVCKIKRHVFCCSPKPNNGCQI